MTSLETLHLQLVKVNAAIDIVLTGASSEYKLNDMQVEQWVKRLSLDDLMKMRDDLEMRIDTAEGTNGGCYVS